MADTAEHVWRRVQLHCPLASPSLALTWVQNAYNAFCDRRGWSFLREEGRIAVKAARTGTVDVTNGSATVAGVGLTFASTDAGRQFRVGSTGIPYTVESVDVGANEATLDIEYGGDTDTAVTAQVLDAYFTAPEDFGRFIAVVDTVTPRRIILDVTEEEYNLHDPQRTLASGEPFALVSQRLNSSDRIRYEWAGYPTSARSYPYWYVKRPEELTDASTFKGPLRHRTDILLKGALAECAGFPGYEGRPNPYYKVDLADRLQAQFLAMLGDLETRDEEVYLTWLQTVGIQELPELGDPFGTLRRLGWRNTE